MAPGTTLQIGLIGDHNAEIPAHRAIPMALREAARMRGVDLTFEWLATDALKSPSQLARFDGLWCVPGSPYRSMDGALLAIAHARESGLPFLGTCGGFQHAVIEYARHVLGWMDAEHAETSPEAPRAVVSMLACALVDATGPVRFMPGTRIAAAYQADHATEGYRCRYGLNPAFQSQLVAGALRATAHDESGDIRAIELIDHPFFVATLFQPERAALQGLPCPLAQAFVDACLQQAKAAPLSRAAGGLRRCVFNSAELCARELRVSELGALQALFDANPGYAMAVNGRPPLANEAQLEWGDAPPAHLPFNRRWFMGLFDGDGALQGVAIVLTDFCAAGVWHISLFWLATALHGRGVASRAYVGLEAWARRSGARWLRLCVVEGNGAGQRLWARHGFGHVCTRHGVDTGGRLNDVHVLVKGLADQDLDQYLGLVPRDRPDSSLS